MNRQQTLEAALNAVNARRAYGPPENNFLRIARRWNLHILNRYGVHLALEPVDVAIMMADMKIARLEETPDHPDSWVDLCGYGACGAEISSGAETVYEPSENPDLGGVIFKANIITTPHVDHRQSQWWTNRAATPPIEGIDKTPVHPAVNAPEFPSE